MSPPPTRLNLVPVWITNASDDIKDLTDQWDEQGIAWFSVPTGASWPQEAYYWVYFVQQ